MQLLKQLGIILAFGYAGEVLSALLPFTIPSSVLGMLLLLLALRLGWIKEEHLGNTAEFLIANLAFFFVPSAVNILENLPLLQSVLGRMVLICVASTLFTFFATYLTVVLVQKLQKGRAL